MVAYSALRRAHRDVPRSGRPDVGLVHVKGDRALISRRQAAGHCRFMPTSLVDSQFPVLEEPTTGEGAIVVSVEGHPREIVAAVLPALGPVPPVGPLALDKGWEPFA